MKPVSESQVTDWLTEPRVSDFMLHKNFASAYVYFALIRVSELSHRILLKISCGKAQVLGPVDQSVT